LKREREREREEREKERRQGGDFTELLDWCDAIVPLCKRLYQRAWKARGRGEEGRSNFFV
jgi:hypothetical protein